ncbi:MAG: pentapeptide repeat-containing protein, partial [Aureispira sp.]
EAGEDIEAWQASLTEIISVLVVTGMPLHLQERRFNQIEEMRLARNAEEALLVALACCAEVTEQLSAIRWGQKESFSEWLGRLSSSIVNKDFAFRNLVYLDLRGANLWHANLGHANLGHADLWHANLKHADLKHANLRYADLRDANLRHANLWHANLKHANLWHANLWDANLRHANLGDADLRGAALSGANLRGAGLTLEQLLSTRTLFEAKGISDVLLQKIKKENPSLLEPPWYEQ